MAISNETVIVSVFLICVTILIAVYIMSKPTTIWNILGIDNPLENKPSTITQSSSETTSSTPQDDFEIEFLKYNNELEYKPLEITLVSNFQKDVAFNDAMIVYSDGENGYIIKDIYSFGKAGGTLKAGKTQVVYVYGAVPGFKEVIISVITKDTAGTTVYEGAKCEIGEACFGV